MVETTKEKKGTKIKEAKKTRGKVEFNRVVWSHMKKNYGVSDQQMLKMHIAVCPAKVKGNPATLARVFDLDVAREKGINVQDYESLNEHPELILYEGYYYGRGKERKVVIEKSNKAASSLLENEIVEGAITDVGVEPEKTGGQKLLHGFGNFLMMGGIVLVLFVIAGIALAVSMLFKGC